MKTIPYPSLNNSTPRTLGELLVLRSHWEHIVSEFKLRDYNGTIDNLKWFIKYGKRSNSFRPHFNKAIDIANVIINEVNVYETSNLSSVHRKA